jgi:hypothetical protein
MLKSSIPTAFTANRHEHHDDERDNAHQFYQLDCFLQFEAPIEGWKKSQVTSLSFPDPAVAERKSGSG